MKEMKKLLYIFKPLIILKRLICKLRSIYYTWKYVDEGGGEIVFLAPFIKFKIKKAKSAVFKLTGKLKIIPFMNENRTISIQMSTNAKLIINNDFCIGQGVKIAMMPNSILKIGGKKYESESGITADTIIMTSKYIEIGTDFLCAWNVFITDSDWHYIKEQAHQSDVIIGDHVWIANNNNILKGSIIGKNCIVASNSKITNQSFPENVLIGGTPAKVLKTGVVWKRDIPKY